MNSRECHLIFTGNVGRVRDYERKKTNPVRRHSLLTGGQRVVKRLSGNGDFQPSFSRFSSEHNNAPRNLLDRLSTQLLTRL